MWCITCIVNPVLNMKSCSSRSLRSAQCSDTCKSPQQLENAVAAGGAHVLMLKSRKGDKVCFRVLSLGEPGLCGRGRSMLLAKSMLAEQAAATGAQPLSPQHIASAVWATQGQHRGGTRSKCGRQATYGSRRVSIKEPG